MNQVEVDYERYANLCRTVGKPVPMFEKYIIDRGLDPKDHLTKEELEALAESKGV